MQNKHKQYCRPSGNEKQQQKDGAVAGKQQAVSTTNRKPAAQLAGERQQRRSFAGFSQRNSNHPNPSSQQSSSSSRNERPKYPIGWAEIEKIDTQVKNKELLEGSSDLLAAMDKESVRLRMDNIWPDFEKQEVFLRLIVLTSSATHAGIQHTTQAFLRRTLQSKLVSSLEKHILQFGPHNQRAVNIVTSLAELLLLGWTTFPSLMADNLAQQTEYLLLKVNQQRSEQFPSKDFDDLLTRLDVAMKSVLERKHAGVSIEQGAGKAGGNRNNQQRWNDESTGPPLEDFRTLDVQLCKEDILAHNEAVYLRKAIVEGPYTDDEHYLDVQFRLLREDLCRPLRAGIHEFRARGNRASGQQNSLLVYNNVHFMGIELHTQDGKILAYFRLSQRDQRRRMSRRFIFGSLICLSDDGFDNNFIFGTVVDRDGIDGGGRRQQQQPKNRRFTIEKRGCIGILLQSVTAASLLRQDIAYHLVESPAFYECYSHVLRALQSIRPGQPIPFSYYLVRMQQNPALPQYQYQRDDRPVLLNFSTLLVHGPEGPEPEMTRCSSTQLSEQFTADQFGMDQSQFEAFAYALRSELAVIQGPPGTGKTFLGLKIVQLLFDNQHLWRNTQDEEEMENDLPLRRYFLPRKQDQERPMLIVCYTNHALDQFLEGILAFLPDGIVRVGGQSKNEALENFNLRNIQNNRNINVDYAQRKRFWECREELKELDKSMQKMKKELFGTTMDPGWIVSYSQLFHQQEDLLEELEHYPFVEELEEHPFDTTLKQKYRAFFAENSCYKSWLTSAKPVGSAAERLECFTYVSLLVRQCHIPEVDSKLAYLYCMWTGDWQMLDNLFEPSIQRAAVKRLRQWLRSSGREPEFREQIAEWPTLAEVDSLLRIGLDEEVAVELLSSIKRDGQYREHLNRLRQHFGGGHQQCSSNNIMEDFEATEPHEYDQDDDDYADQENEARRFDDGGDISFDDDDDFPAADELGGLDRRVEEHTFQESAKLRKFLGKISTPLSDSEAQQMAIGADQTDPWDLPLLTRWRLYRRWVQQWKPGGEQEHSRLIREYCAKRNELDELRSLADIEIMRRAKVIGMTTTKAAHLQSALRSVKPRIVVVEEAAEVFEQHIVTALTECCEHLILIGDHQQLRPAPADYWLGKKYNLDISLFERLVLNGFDYRQLRLQHRMRPEIASTMMGHFYANLQDHSSVRAYPDVLGLQKNLFFLNHSQPESSKQDEAKSHANPFEAEFAVQLAKYLHKQGYEGSQITILCTYSDQFFEIRQRLAKCFGADKSHGIRVANVDNYQGEECDIIILSLVRSNNPMNRIGFLNTPNRVCVAMSRAKHGFYIIGNMDFLAKNCNTSSPNSSGAENSGSKNLWADIKQSLVAAECIGSALPIVCQVHGNKQQIAQPKQFEEFAPEGGCTQPCGVRMDCGHTCRKPCHAFDPEHTQMKCMEKCGRMCANELHNCPKWCYEECGSCYELVLRTLPCGHSQEAPCHLNLEDLHCKEPCQSKLPCGHLCANNCSEKCTEKCEVPMERKLPCGHTMTLECHLDPFVQQCEQLVNKVWPICGHVAEAKCCADPAQLSCPAPCGQPLADCGHLCSGTCGKCRRGRLHQDCAQDCNRILICGHECREKCARVCPPCALPCETACVHSKCNMKVRHPKNKNNPGRKCGERCAPCAEKCANQCAHQACSRKCSEPCDVDPCLQPCNKPLPCSILGPKPRKGSVNNSFQIVHPCIGVCGEQCLDICAICNPERLAEIKEIFFGTEDEENARFVKLADCGHIFEAKGLDMAIKVQLESRSTDGGDSAAIVVIKCPKCSTPIRRSTRYIKLLNERAAQIDKVKKKLLGDKTKAQLLAEWEQLKTALMEKQLPIKPMSTSSAAEVEAIQQIQKAFKQIKASLGNYQNHEITGQWMVMAENIDRLLLGFTQALKRIFDSYSVLDVGITAGVLGQQHLYNALHNTIRVEHLRAYLLRDLAELLGSLAQRKVRSLAESTLDQMANELAQHNFLISIFQWVGTRHKHQRGDIDAKGEQMLTNLLSNMQAAPAFSEQKEKLEQMFNDLVNYTGDVPVSSEEMVQIQRALAGHVTKWYSCPKGHVYGIGECGQAMHESHCIECKETVGGSRHQLVATNREAADLNRDYHLRRAAENPFQARF